MTRTTVSANAWKPRPLILNREVEALTDKIEGFGVPEIGTNFIDKDEEPQTTFQPDYEDFRDSIEYLSEDFATDAAEFQLKVDDQIKEGEAMNPLPHSKLEELDALIEEISQKNNFIQAQIATAYEEIVQKLRRIRVPNSDKEMFKAIGSFLQIEKSIKKNKVNKVLTSMKKKACLLYTSPSPRD